MTAKVGTYPQNFFEFNRYLLTVGGIWTPENASPLAKKISILYKIYVFFGVYLWFTLSEFASIADTYRDVYTFIDSLNITSSHVIGIVKTAVFLVKGREVFDLLDLLESPNLHYEKAADFDPYAIVSRAKITGYRWTFVYFSLACGAALSLFLLPFYTIIKIFITGEALENTVLYRNQPLICKVPFNFDTKPRYLLMLIYAFVPHFTYGHTLVGVDGLIMNSMNFIGCQMELITNAIRTIKERALMRVEEKGDGLLKNSIQLQTIMDAELKKAIKHLQLVIRVSDRIENIFNYVVLTQVLTSILVLCSSLFLVTTTPVGSKRFSGYLAYMSTVYFQLIGFCWFGNEVTVKAAKIPMAIWECEWLGVTKSFKTSMMITMRMMQREFYFTIGKFAPINLSSFVAIMKVSYSYFALLRKVKSGSEGI